MLGNRVNLMSKHKNISWSYNRFNVVKLFFYEIDLFSISNSHFTECIALNVRISNPVLYFVCTLAVSPSLLTIFHVTQGIICYYYHFKVGG